jgi:hypothetical protein
MNVIYGELWTKCSRDIISFVIMHLLDGLEEEDPWCVLIIEGVGSENDVIQVIHMECDEVSRVKQCFVDSLPFTVNRGLNDKIALVACF